MDFIEIRAQHATLHAEPPAALPDDGFVWCDCTYADGTGFAPVVEPLAGVQVFDDHLRDVDNATHPSFFDATGRYEMLIFRGLAQSPESVAAHGSVRIRTRPTTFFVLPRMLVTVRAPDSRIFAGFRERLLESRAARARRLPGSPEEAMLQLLNDMVDRYLAMRQPLTDVLDRRQRELLDPRRPFHDWPGLLQARTELRKLENLCEEQLDAVQEWRDEHLDRHGQAQPHEDAGRLRVRAHDLTGHIERVLNHARRLQSAVESAVQLHFAATSHRTNEVMRLLTAVTAIFMPLTLITGIFGMNFDAIPGLHSRYGFWLTMGAMLAVALLTLGYFRTRQILAHRSASQRMSADSAGSRGTARARRSDGPGLRNPRAAAARAQAGGTAGPTDPDGAPEAASISPSAHAK